MLCLNRAEVPTHSACFSAEPKLPQHSLKCFERLWKISFLKANSLVCKSSSLLYLSNLLKLPQFGRSSLTAVALLSSVLRDFEPSVLLNACLHQNSNFFTSFTQTRKIKISAQNLVWKKVTLKVTLKRNFSVSFSLIFPAINGGNYHAFRWFFPR